MQVLKTAMRLLHAIVDILSSKNHLAACILAMEMCQMVVQGMHARDPLLMQVPGVSRTLAEHCEREGAPYTHCVPCSAPPAPVTSHSTHAWLQVWIAL